MLRNALGLFLLASLVWGVDVTGEWKASAEGPNGTMERTFSLKAEGAKLTGETVSSFLGKSTIDDGKVDGDNLSFTIVAKLQDNEMKLNYKGKVVSNGEIKFTSQAVGNEGQVIEWTAKRVK